MDFWFWNKEIIIDFWQENKNTIIYHGSPAVIVLAFIFLNLDYSSFENFCNSLFFTNPFLIIGLIFFGKRFLQLLWAILIQILTIKAVSLNERLIAHVGPPGAGKTVMAGFKCNVIAGKLWKELELKYFLNLSLLDKYYREKNDKAILDFQELQASYNYFKRNRNTIKCLISNLPILKKSRGKEYYCSKLEIEHVKQIKRLPSYSCWLEDEVDLEQGSNTSRNIEPVIQATYKLPRHLGEWIIFLTAQNPNKLGDFIRGCVDHIIACQSQKWFLEPKLLIKIYDIKKAKFLKKCRKYKFNEKEALKILKFNSYLRTIGFRKIKYKKLSNTELNTESDALRGKRGAYYIPAVPSFKYSDRAWRDTYQCKDDFIICKTFNRLYLDSEDLKFQIYKEQKNERNRKTKKTS
jgi:hypothetical protein